MAFKMKGPSLLKMVKQMRENSPAKQDKKEDPNAQTVEVKEDPNAQTVEVKEGKSTRKVTPRVISPAEQKLIDADKKQKAARKAAKKEKMRKEIMEERKLVDIPKKKIKPLPNPIEKPKLRGGLFNV